MWGIKINGAKCKIISPQSSDIAIDGQTVEVVKQFVLLGSSVPDSSTDISRRKALEAGAFRQICLVSENLQISSETYLKLLKF